MKNTIKKAICTTLAAVSLSAFVTFPPPPSNPLPKTGKDIVNVLEANAGGFFDYRYSGYITYSPKGLYNTRTKGGNKIIPENELKKDKWNKDDYRLYAYKQVYVYEVDGKWARISPDNETYKGKKRERWVLKSRIYADKIGCQDGHDHAHMDYDVCYMTIRQGKAIDLYICTYCGKRWTKVL